MPLNHYFSNFQQNDNEQKVFSLLTQEMINMSGINVIYLPRTLNNIDSIYGESNLSSFDSSYTIPMLINSVDGFEGEDYLSQFGLQIKDRVILTVSKKEFDSSRIPNITRPMEGDWIYLNLNKKLFEIKFVEHETQQFYQRGSLYSYELRCDLVDYNQETLNTGDAVIDSIDDQFEFTLELTLSNTGSGIYSAGETIYQGASLNTATVKATVNSYDDVLKKLVVSSIDGTFTPSINITGETTNAQYLLTSIQDSSNISSAIFDTQAASLIDFSESNPFGSF